MRPDVLGLTYRELVDHVARAGLEGPGLAPKVYRRAMLVGDLELEALGLSPRRAEPWRAAFGLSLPTLARRADETLEDGTVTTKVAVRLADGAEVECVRIPMVDRHTLCISSQVGCKLACTFCETGRMGLVRNLSAAEIVAQVVFARRELGPVENVVFMGMGEPLDNVDEVMQAIRVLTERRGLAYGQQRIRVSTAGRPDGLVRLAELGMPRMDLTISLNAATDAARSALMPVNRKYPLASLQEAVLALPRRRSFVLGLGYCLMPGINDRREDARAIAEFARPLGRVLVNVIPYNPGRAPLTRAPTEAEIVEFIGWLDQEGLPVKRRVTKGRSVMAACGQLGEPRRRQRATAG